MYCNQCGKQIQDGNVFCPMCGAQQQTLPQQTAQPPKPRHPEKMGKGWKIAMFCTLGAAVAALIVFVSLTWLVPKPAAADTLNPDDSVQAEVPGGSRLSLADTGALAAQQQIIGAWETVENGVYYGYEFCGDGTVRVIENGADTVYNYTIDDMWLTVLQNDAVIAMLMYSIDEVLPEDEEAMLTLALFGDTTLVLSKTDALSEDGGTRPDVAQTQADIIGVWEAVYEGVYIGFEFLPDGTCWSMEDMDMYEYQYRVSGSDIIIFQDGEEATLPFTLEGTDLLTVMVDGEPIVFSRTQAFDPQVQLADAIIGCWEGQYLGEYEGYEFYSDGTLRNYWGSDEVILDYSLNGDQITFSSMGAVLGTGTVEIDGYETLYITVNDEWIELYRVASLNPPLEDDLAAGNE